VAGLHSVLPFRVCESRPNRFFWNFTKPSCSAKKLENHRAAVALWVSFYNLCRVHETLRCTPAMALDVTDHIWTIAELVTVALEPSDVPPLPRPTPETTLRPGLTRSGRM
jgi:hypothetical protein